MKFGYTSIFLRLIPRTIIAFFPALYSNHFSRSSREFTARCSCNRSTYKQTDLKQQDNPSDRRDFRDNPHGARPFRLKRFRRDFFFSEFATFKNQWKTLSLSLHYKPKSVYRIVLTHEPYCPAYIYISYRGQAVISCAWRHSHSVKCTARRIRKITSRRRRSPERKTPYFSPSSVRITTTHLMFGVFVIFFLPS